MGTEITGGQIKDGTVRNVDVASDAAIAITKLDSNVASKTYVDTAVAGATGIPTGSLQMYAGATAPNGWLFCTGDSVSRSTYATLFATIVPTIGNPTITIASPGVLTINAHGLSNGAPVFLETAGIGASLPTGLAERTLYYVVNATANTVQLSTTNGGTAINTSGSQSGTHKLYYSPFGASFSSSTFYLPNFSARVPIGAGTGAQDATAGAGRISGGTALTTRGLGYWGGAETHSLILAQMPSHRHTLNAVSSLTQTGSAQAAGAAGTPAWGVTDYAGGSSAGSNGDSHNNVQPFLVLKFIIKY